MYVAQGGQLPGTIFYFENAESTCTKRPNAQKGGRVSYEIPYSGSPLQTECIKEASGSNSQNCSDGKFGGIGERFVKLSEYAQYSRLLQAELRRTSLVIRVNVGWTHG